MNKVISINLGGTAFQLEEAGYDALRAYLESARARLRGNPDIEEILSDIERAMGEKFSALLSAHKNVVLTSEVDAVLAQMGPIQDDSATGTDTAGATTGSGVPPAGAASQEGASGIPPPKRLYRIHEGAMLGGVCNGLGAYFNIDPTIVRLAAILLTLLWGAGILVYGIMVLVVPSAVTPEQKAAATGSPWTTQDFVRRAKEGYYDAMRSFPDRQARREWKRRFKQEMREWRRSFRHEMAGPPAPSQTARYSRFAMHPAAGLAMPVVSLLHGALLVVWICFLVSLLATGSVLGVSLPDSTPVWIAVLILIVVYGMLVWPLKAFRRAYFYGGGAASGGAWLFLLVDVAIWLAVVGALLWLAMHYSPQAREAAHNIPAVGREAVQTISSWWHGS